jgi:hypothetical protein
VKDIAESLIAITHKLRLVKTRRYTVKDILHIKETVILSQSLVENYPKEINEALKTEDIHYLATLDYCALVDWEGYKKRMEVA